MLRRVLATFGCGDCGRLGLGVDVLLSQEVPHVVRALLDTQLQQVACGGAHTVAVAEDGSVYSFGLNDRAQLGHSPEEKEVHVPLEVPVPEAVTAVAAGYYHTLALSEAGRVWAFGCNAVGQLGLGSNAAEVVPEPRLVQGLEGQQVVAIAAGMEHSLAVTAGGEVYSWGCGHDGRLGHSKPASMRFWGNRNEPQPRLIRALEALRIASVAAGQMHSAAVTTDGRVLVWGSNRFHQLGLGQSGDCATPLEVPGLSGIGAVACGGLHSLAAQSGGAVYTFGANQNGCLGLGSAANQEPRRPVPVAAPGLTASSVAAGWKHSAAVSRSGQLFTWGWGGSQGTTYAIEEGSSTGGQLGLGDENDYWAPTRVEWLVSPKDWVGQDVEEGRQAWRVLQVACGLNHTAAVIELQPEVELA